MNTVLWIIQILLALTFVFSGFMKMTQPKDKLRPMMGWVDDFALNTIKIIGFLEVLAAVGLILPALTGILPFLTGLAAVGLVLTMIGGALVHFRRKEYSVMPVNIVLLALALFVAYGRFVLVPLV
jgi:uncharacterized membrane protein YphA (DoxX/SURF4 family)